MNSMSPIDPTDPALSVAVRASAGTGKTRLLAMRYLKLVTAGVEPKNILALTFTRKAAGEMRDRVLSLASTEAWIPPATRRKLLDHFEDITISTIDSFCQGLLREFPLEVELDPAFELLDAPVVRGLRDEVAAEVATMAMRHRSPVALKWGERGLSGALSTLLERRQLLESPVLTSARAPRSLVSIDQWLRVSSDRAGAILGGRAGWDEIAARGAQRAAAFVVESNEVADFLSRDSLRLPAYETLCSVFLTVEGNPRGPRGILPYKKSQFHSTEDYAWYRDRVVQLAPRLFELKRQLAGDLNRILVRDLALYYRMARARFAVAKRRAGGLDFDDILDLAARMLREMPEFALTRYLIEPRFQHILVDEFQDTNARQWDIIRSLVDPWRHGRGVAENPTIMIVGDEKQSIYGFRSADVAVFRRAGKYVASLGTDPGHAPAVLRKSYRAYPRLLSFVNDLFDGVPKAVAECELDFAFSYDEADHFPIDEDRGLGSVSLCVEPTPAACAAAIAGEVCHLLRDRPEGHSMRPGDIAVLFRTRSGYQLYEEALKRAGIPCYVYRGIGFYDRPEVLDVAALIAYLANPASDLGAASLLRSRIARVSDPGILAISKATGSRMGKYLDGSCDVPGLDADDSLAGGALRASVPRWIAATDTLPPVELVERILEETLYRAELKDLQAREDLKKILNILRRLQNHGYMTMSRLAARLEEESAVEEAGAVIESVDAVNLMTIHAAKGLEFKAVFLVGVEHPPRIGSPLPHIYLPGGTTPPEVDMLDIPPEHLPEPVRHRELEDEKRLLYVAVTRASERLYLSAANSTDGRIPAKGLFALFPEGLRAAMQEAADTNCAEVVWRPAGAATAHDLSLIHSPSVTPVYSAEAGAAELVLDLEPVSAEPGIRRTAASEKAGKQVSEGGRLREVAEVGRVVHRMLELELPVDERVAERAAALIHPDIPAYEVAKTAERAADLFRLLAVREDLRRLLASGERIRELPFALLDDDSTLIRGVIDCLVMRPDECVVIDYKTGRRQETDIAQMRIYLKAIQKLVGPAVRVTGRLFYASGEPAVVERGAM
ncbi:MAG: UvrD-helicase domain-containing protein [Acidobacteria bacterium]|nr:UvrD-helicase domain-containing protein [Acidobacteriota bacterium]